jgi:predicted nucleotidyltransferase
MIRGPHADRLDRHGAEIAAIVRKHGGASPRVFGSVARDEETPSSDIDLLVDQGPEGRMSLLDLCAMEAEIADLLQAPVQVVTPRSLSPRLRTEAERDAKPL